MGKHKMNYTLNLKLRGEEVFFGPGVVELLQHISQTSSINMAAREMGMSYNKAWRILKRAEEELGFPLVLKSVGGSNGGGSKITAEGKVLIEKFLSFQTKTYEIADTYFNEIFDGIWT